MSHVAVKMWPLTDLEVIKAVCKQMGLEFKEGQKTYKWWGKWYNDYHSTDAAYRNGINPVDYGKCEHAIGIPKGHPLFGTGSGYEAGLAKNPKGPGYVLIMDFMDNSLVQAMDGNAGEGFIQKYKAEAIRQSEGEKFAALGCVEHLITEENGDQWLVYEDEGQTDESLKQYIGGN